MISLAILGGLAIAKKWGLPLGVIGSYLLYITYSINAIAGLATTALLVIYARGLQLDKLTVYALLIAHLKFLLLPYALGRPIPYYEALWYAHRVNPIWQTYAPLTYLPKEPPLQLAVEGTIFVASTAALASRALAEITGPKAVLWPLLAPEPIWFGQWNVAMPLVWIAAYYATKRKPGHVVVTAALAAGFHIYAGVLALGISALYIPQLLLLVPLMFLTPQSNVLLSLIGRIFSINPLQLLPLLTARSPLWIVKAAIEFAIIVAISLKTGKPGVIPWAGLIASAIIARSPEEFASYAYRHFQTVMPLAKLSKKEYFITVALALIPYVLQVHYFGLSWDWAVAYSQAFAAGTPIHGPIEEAYSKLYIKQG